MKDGQEEDVLRKMWENLKKPLVSYIIITIN